MPFTFSHPAAVVPLRRCGLVFSAMVVGSMAPDFEYFFRLTQLGRTSHHYPGVITFTLPIALAVLLVFHLLVKWPLISVLPRGLQSRILGPARQFRWWPASRLLIILLSLAVGIATHILADSFTHNDGWAVLHWPILRAQVIVISAHRFPLFQLLQFGTSFLGGATLAVYFGLWYRHAAQQEKLPPQLSTALNTAILCTMVAIAATFGVLNGIRQTPDLMQGLASYVHFGVRFVITSTCVGAMEVFGFSVIWRTFLVRTLSQQRVGR